MPIYPTVSQAGIVMPGASAHALALADLSPVLANPSVEPFASHHILFGADNVAMVDGVTGQAAQRNIIITIGAGGAGYEASGPLAFAGFNGSVPPVGLWFATNGAVTSAIITSPGVGNTVAGAATATTATGTGATFNVAIGSAPVVNAASVATAGGGYNGLMLPSVDSIDETLIVVHRRVSSNMQMVVGTLSNQAPYATAYGAQLLGQATYTLTTRPGAGASVAAPGATGDWLFAAISHRATGDRLVFYGGAAPTTYTPAAQIKGVPAAPVRHAIGNCYFYDNAYRFAVEVAEYIRIPRGCSAVDLAVIYARSKARLAARGVVVL